MKKPSRKKPPTFKAPRTPEAREEQAEEKALRTWGETLEAVAVEAMVAAGGDPKRCAWTKPNAYARIVEVDGVPFKRVEMAGDGVVLTITTTDLREVQ